MFNENERAASGNLNACRAKNKKGEPCAAPATDTGFCYVHSKPGRAAEIGREGGRRNRQIIDAPLPPLPDLSTTSGIRNAIAQILQLTYDGQLNGRRTEPLARLFSTLERLTSSSELDKLEEKIKVLQKALENGALPAVSEEKKHSDAAVSSLAKIDAISP